MINLFIVVVLGCVGLGALVLVTLWMGLYPEPILGFVIDAAAMLRGGPL